MRFSSMNFNSTALFDSYLRPLLNVGLFLLWTCMGGFVWADGEPAMPSATTRTKTGSPSEAGIGNQGLANGVGLNVRVSATTSSAIVKRLDLGETFKLLDWEVDEKGREWLKIAFTSSGNVVGTGYLLRTYILPFASRKKALSYVALGKAQLAREELSPQESYALADFLDKAFEETGAEGDGAVLGFQKLEALEKLSNSITVSFRCGNATGDTPAWVEKAIDRFLATDYVDCGTFVPPGAFWELWRKLPRGHSRAEELAWTASNRSHGGECEGYLPCYFGSFMMGRFLYLEKYPRGKYAPQVLESVASWVGDIGTNWGDFQSEYKFIDVLRRLRKVIVASNLSKKESLIQELDRLVARL